MSRIEVNAITGEVLSINDVTGEVQILQPARFIESPNVPMPILTKAIADVTPRQARLALLQGGLLATVDAAITTPEEKIWWEYTTIFERENQILKNIAAKIGLTPSQIDSLFKLAATL